MELIVGGVVRADLAGETVAAAGALAARGDAPEFLDASLSAITLNGAADETDYLNRMMNLLAGKTGVSTMPFYIPRRAGWRGRLTAGLKQALWKLLRYQHDRTTFQQNTINLQWVAALEFVHKEHRSEIARLRAELAALRKEAGVPHADAR